MGTLVDKLNYLKETKTAIKNAITAKGVSVSDTDTFRSYANKIGEIQSGSSGGGSENNAIIDFSKHTNGAYIYKLISSIDASSFDTSKVTDMQNMFSNCPNLVSLDLSSFDTSKVVYMNYMFNNCPNLVSLDLSSFDTSKVVYMNYMFNKCSNLVSLDLSSFNTSNVTNMNSMFNDCSNLVSLDLSSFDTSNVTNITYMFDNCSKLKTLTLGNNWAPHTKIKSFDLSTCRVLSRDSLVDIINKLATRTNSPTIKLDSDLKNLLTDSEKAIATGKGWTIA